MTNVMELDKVGSWAIIQVMNIKDGVVAMFAGSMNKTFCESPEMVAEVARKLQEVNASVAAGTLDSGVVTCLNVFIRVTGA